MGNRCYFIKILVALFCLSVFVFGQDATISGETKIIKGIECVLVKAGTFIMGAADNESGQQNDEFPRRQITITKDFYIGKSMITQAQYMAVMGNNPSYFKGDNLPVESVSWYDAVAFCKKLGGRLPTEAEWEFAARGGNKSKGYKYSGSNDLNEAAWYRNNSGETTHPVGTKIPNEIGIYGMSGNVWEWCNDWYDFYPSGPATDPKGPLKGTHRVIRGGSWSSVARVGCRVAIRDYIKPERSSRYWSFRIVFNAN